MNAHHLSPILIVDDDEDDREFIREAFLANHREQEYVFIADGEHLMEYLSAAPKHPHLILLDLNMPRKDGREALREIKSNGTLHHIPVVVLTTSSLESDRQTSYDLGANCFVTKPDSFNKLVDVTNAIAKLWLQSGQ